MPEPTLSLVRPPRAAGQSPSRPCSRAWRRSPCRDFEVIVVDQNADGRVGTPKAEGWSFPITHLRTPTETGLSRARNSGPWRGRPGASCCSPTTTAGTRRSFLAHALCRDGGQRGPTCWPARAADAAGRDINGRFAKAATRIDRSNVLHHRHRMGWCSFERAVLEAVGGYGRRHRGSAPRRRGRPARAQGHHAACARPPAPPASSILACTATQRGARHRRAGHAAQGQGLRPAGSATCCGATAIPPRPSPPGSPARSRAPASRCCAGDRRRFNYYTSRRAGALRRLADGGAQRPRARHRARRRAGSPEGSRLRGCRQPRSGTPQRSRMRSGDDRPRARSEQPRPCCREGGRAGRCRLPSGIRPRRLAQHVATAVEDGEPG